MYYHGEVIKPRKWRGSYLSLAPEHTGISEKWRAFVSSSGSNSHHLQEQISPDLMEGAQEIGTMAFWVESTQTEEGTGTISSGIPAEVGGRSLHLQGELNS